jgi:hypothetical protein
MTRRRFTGALVAFLAVSGVALRAHDEFRFVGTVVSMDAAKNRLGVKFKEANGKEETVQIAIKSTTEITRDKKKVPKTALKAGISVVVDALGDDYNTLEALEIRIVPPPSK